MKKEAAKNRPVIPRYERTWKIESALKSIGVLCDMKIEDTAWLKTWGFVMKNKDVTVRVWIKK